MLKRYLRDIYKIMVLFGVDPLITLSTIRAIPGYFRDLATFKEQARVSSVCFKMGHLWPFLHDKSSESGVASGHYFHQDLLVARRVLKNDPRLHVDIGSRVDGFVAHVAIFREIQVFDIRRLENNVRNIRFFCVDLMSPISDDFRDYCDSVSCLHALEHFGLGRYGDPINYNGYLDGLDNIYKILKQGGKFYFSVPIGPQRVEFNGHRVFSLDYLFEFFAERYQIDMFSYVDDRGELQEDVTPHNEQIHDNYGCNCGCGIFEMTKL